jgi:hypothetical protein
MSSVSLRIGHNSLSCKIQHFSHQVLGVCHLLGSSPWLLGVKFASLHDLYGASRSSHKVLDELIPKVLLSTLKPCINTKLQNRHAHMNLLYHGGQYQWIRYKTYANIEGKLIARFTDFHCQQRPGPGGHRSGLVTGFYTAHSIMGIFVTGFPNEARYLLISVCDEL